MSSLQPIGVFDSGLGGLSVLHEVWRQLPDESTVYLADHAHFPYGVRPAEEVCALAEARVHSLIKIGVKTVVIACNTASAAALEHLRARFPGTPTVGMEPAVKPAALRTHTRVVGVLATGNTLRAKRYDRLVARFAAGVRVIPVDCPELVELVESGPADGERTAEAIRSALSEPLAQGMDTLVLGCTHFSWLVPAIRRLAGARLEIVDPAPAVARQLRRVLAARGLQRGPSAGRPQERTAFYTTGSAPAMQVRLSEMLGETWAVSCVPASPAVPTLLGQS